MNRTSTKIIFTICTVFLLFFAAFSVTQSVNIAYAEEIQKPTATATGACGTNATWTYYEDTSTLEISGSGSVNTYNVGATPWYSYADNIKKIIVNDGITGISSGLFSGMSALEELTIPFVGRDQYISSSSSTSESNKHYPLGYMFGNSSYTGSVSVRQYYTYDYLRSGKYYEDGASYTEQYYIPTTLKTVTVTNAKYIFYGAFSYLYSDYSTGSTRTSPLNITTINLNEGIKRIGSYAFASYNYCSESYKGNTSYQYITSNLENVNLPSTLTYISDSAFYNCVKLNNVEIPGTVTDIGDYAFWNCKALHTQIGENVKSIGSYAFYGCSSLDNQTFPTTLTSIGSGAFMNCTAFTEINIPQNVTSIGDSAFSGCSSVTAIILEEGVKTIGSGAFCNINKVTKITIPTTVTSMGSGLFSGMSALEELTIPFVGRDQYISSSSSTSESNKHYPLGYMFGNSSYTGSVSVRQYYTYDYLRSGKYYEDGASYTEQYYIPTTLKTVTVTNAKYIFYGAFSYLYSDYSTGSTRTSPLNITTINLNEGIKRIGSYAFASYNYCSESYKGNTSYQYITSNLENVNLPSTLTYISDSAFYNCVKLNNVEIPGTVTDIGDYAFWNCKAATINILRNTTDITAYQHTFTNVPIVKYFDYYSYTNGNNTFYYNVFDGNAVLQKTVTTDTDLTLPTALGGYTLVKVGNMGVANCTTLTSIVIPANISELSDYAFSECTGLVTVTIPATCLHVGDYAFNGCTSITTTTIAEGVKYVGDYAFFNCKNLQEIVIPDSCEYLGQGAFYNCSGMKSATIGITIPTIEDYTFMNCSSLETIVVGLKVTSIGNYAFKNCTSIGRITLRKGLVSIGDGAFMNCSAISRVTLAATISDIGSYAFYGCSSLGSVTIPAAVTTIKQSTFENCTSLAVASYNGTVGIIENRAFYGTAVSAFEFKNGLTRLGSDAFAKTALTNVVLPDSLTVIGQHVFDHCQLTSISMPSCVKLDTNCIRIFENNGKGMVVTIRFVNDAVLDDYLLYNSGAKQIVLENGIEKIGNYTFAKNIFAEIDLPETLTDIGNYAFYLCENLNNVHVPKNTVNIDTYAFAKTFAMTNIYMPDSLKNIGEYALWKVEDEDVHELLTVTIYNNCGNIVDSLFENQHMQYVVIENSVKTIGNSVFASCPNLRSVIVGNSVKTIGNKNFAECPKLEIVSVPDTVQTFGQNNFLNDNSVTLKIRKVDGTIDDHVYQDNLLFVTTVLIEEGISVIGEYAFYNDTSVQVISVPNSVNTIGQYAFYNCNSIKEINIPNGVTAIRSHTFFGCASLENIVTPNSVTLIEDYAFYGCVEAKNLTISNNCKSIGDNAFYNCKSITALEIPSSVTKIGSYAFRSCILITELDFSDNVDDIGECAFYDCNALKIVRLGKRVTELKDRMFYGCVNLTDLYVNAPLSFIDELAFYGAEDVTIHCGRDDYMIAFFEENGLNYEIDEFLVYEYKVVFKDADGNVLSSALYKYGEIVTEPATPQKAADNTYTYTFKSWDKVITKVGGNAEYIAVFESHYIDYTVVFKNYDGTVLSSRTYHYGDTVTEPSVPTKPADNTYTYTFKAWDKEVTSVSDSVTYTATYDATYIEYTVVFKNYDGTILSSTTYHYDDTVTEPPVPTKPADNTYTYTFKAWDKEVTSVSGNVTYTATYDATYIEYTVVFKNYDGTVLSSKTYHYGDTVEEPSTPTKPADNTYTYVFKGWNKNIVAVSGDAEYIAQFDPVYIEYTVVFKNYDDSVLSSETYHYGDIVATPETPNKPSDNVYFYTFNGWDKTVVACNGNAEYKATYLPNYREYSIVFKNYDGTILSQRNYHYDDDIIVPENPTQEANLIGTFEFVGWDKKITKCQGDKVYTATYDIVYIDYTVIFKNYDGTVLSSKTYHYSDAVEEPSTPTKPADNTYTYTFKAWDKEVVSVAGNVTYTATYDATYIEYTIVFKNYDGTVLSSKAYHYGDTVAEPSTPKKAADNTYTYVFKSWDKNVVAVNGNAEYIAQFDSVHIEYTIIFKNYDGMVLSSKTYHYGDAVEEPKSPVKPADNTYTYMFKAWDKEVVSVSGNVTYTATYEATYIEYMVVFKNYDGTVLSSKTYHYGDTVEEPSTPTKPADNACTYEFNGWSKGVTTVVDNIEYVAQYKATFKDYTVIFKNYDGTILSSTIYHFGDAIAEPTKPTKPSDNTYNYVFSGWNKTITTCTGNTEYEAMFSAQYIEYYVVFKNYDDSEISRRSYHYGDMIEEPDEPTKPEDLVGTYQFTGWDKEIVACTRNMTYKATYSTIYKEYKVEFRDYDGTILHSDTYHYGDTVFIPQKPTRASDEKYDYVFSGWDKEVVPCNGNAVYTAAYDETYIEYTIVFKNYDGTVLSSKTYHYGDTVVEPSTPTKPADSTYTYTFKEWNQKVTSVSGNITYTATYDATYIEYTVVFKNYDGTVLSSKIYHYGETVEEPSIPTRPADNTYTYTFACWDKEITDCVGNETYTATYSFAEVKDSRNESLSGGAIAGIATGSAAAVGLGGFSLFWFVIKKKRFSDLFKGFKKK